MQSGIVTRKLSVRPSVCPSVRLPVSQTCWLWQKRIKFYPDFYTIWKIIDPSFVRVRIVSGRRPLLPEILDQTDPVGAKPPILIDIRS